MNLIPRRRGQYGLWVDPLRELEKLQNDMSSLFNLSITDPNKTSSEGNLTNYALSPLVDCHEDKDNILVKVDLPGIDKKNIEVNVEDCVLTIKAERQSEDKSKEHGARLTERYSGHLYRQLSFSTAIDETKVVAEYKDGVLSLTLPKKEEAKPKQIKVDIK